MNELIHFIQFYDWYLGYFKIKGRQLYEAIQNFSNWVIALYHGQ